jgi:hypothetical protein
VTTPMRRLTVEETLHPSERRRVLTRWIVGGTVGIIFLLSAAVVWLAYLDGIGLGADEPPPLIRAEPGPIKRLPDSPGGQDVANADSNVVTVFGRERDAPRIEQILPRETPPAVPPPTPPTPEPDQIMAAGDVPPVDAPATPAAGTEPPVTATAPPDAVPPPGPIRPLPPSPPAAATPAGAAGPVETAALEVLEAPEPPTATTPPTALPVIPSAALRPTATPPAEAPPAASATLRPAATPPAAPAPAAPRRLAAVAPADEPARAPAPAAPPAARTAARPPAAEEPAGRSLPAAGPIFRVQLGAFRSDAAAGQAWRIYQRQHQAVLGDLRANVVVADTSSGTFYRLQAGPLANRDAAVRACGQIKSGGGDCFIVGPLP